MKQQDIWRCHYHITPPTGWMNDPNGVCQFQGTYHIFFQYAPDYPKDDNKSWGHYISKDLLHWEFIGTTFYPDSIYDKNGAFSGNALIENEEMIIYYTGNVEQEGDHDYTHSGRESNTIRVTSKDGIHFSEKNCVLDNSQYPQHYTCHIRDPKVWKNDALYQMVMGGRTIEDYGSILLFQSADGVHWNYTHDLTSRHPFGFMWECPDVFQMNGQWFLSFCPQGVPVAEYHHQNYHLSGYVPISEEWLTKGISGDFIDEIQFLEWDYGFDFYAPQTFVDDKGRRILIGWVGGPDMTYPEPTLEQYHWIHKLTLPRVLTYQDGHLLQKPIPELEQLRSTKHVLKNDVPFVTNSNCFDWNLELPESDSSGFTISITDEFTFAYDGHVLSLTFSDSTEQSPAVYGNIGAGRTCRKVLCEMVQNIRILVDCSVVEIYVNDGAIVQTTHFFPKETTLPLLARGNFRTNCLWDMA